MTPLSSQLKSGACSLTSTAYASFGLWRTQAAQRFCDPCLILHARRSYGGAQSSSDSVLSQSADAFQDSAPLSTTNPAALVRQLYDTVPSNPPSSFLQHVRSQFDLAGWTADPATILGGIHHQQAQQQQQQQQQPGSGAGLQPDADSILASVVNLMQRAAERPLECAWVRASLPELLLLLARLRIPSHPKLEVGLILLIRRGALPAPLPALATDAASYTPSQEHAGAASGGGNGGGGGGSGGASRRRNRGSDTAPTSPLQAALPTAFRLAQAMAALPIGSHEAWQVLAARQLASRTAAPLDALTVDQLALLAGAFARGGYHPVELFGTIADRVLRAAPYLQTGSLTRLLHAFAVLRHHDPLLTASLLDEVHRRMAGGGDGEAVGASTRHRGSGGGGLLSLAGAAIFGSGRGGGPDRAHRPPQFLLEDLARLGVAAVQLGAGEAAVRQAYGVGDLPAGGDGTPLGVAGAGGRGGWSAGDVLLAAVAEEAEEAVAARVRRVVEAAAAVPIRAPAEVGTRVGGQASPSARVSASTSDGRAVEGRKGKAALSVSPGADPTGHGSSRGAASDPGSGGPVYDSDAVYGTWMAEQLDPVMGLLGALVAGGAAGPSTTAARTAHIIAVEHLVPELPTLEPYMSPQHLVTLMAAMLPGAAAALRQTSHPYPFSRPSARSTTPSGGIVVTTRSANPAAGHGSSGGSGGNGGGGGTPGNMLEAVVSALCRRADPRVLSSARSLFAAWHTLAAARAVQAAGADDTRVVRHLAPLVFTAVLRQQPLVRSGSEAARIVVSCALLSSFHQKALDLMAARIVTLLGPPSVPSSSAVGGGASGGSSGSGYVIRQPQPQQWPGPGAFPTNGATASGEVWVGGGGGGGVTQPMAPAALAQLGWAVGQLGYNNQDLLAALQAQALAWSAPPPPFNDPLFGPDLGASGGGGGSTSSGAAYDSSSSRGRYDGSRGAAAPPGTPLLGPLELADVLWGLTVNEYRTNRGADIRELYVRAAAHGVVRIDDRRWLQLVRVHLLLLLGWAGGLGEAAGQLSSSWFNALGYAWERQAVDPGEHLAGPTGLPPDPDPPAAAFRTTLTAALRELSRSGLPTEAGGGGGGKVRLQAGYSWAMLQPSADVRLTLPLLLRVPRLPQAPAVVAGAQAAGGGSVGNRAAAAAGGSSGSGSSPTEGLGGTGTADGGAGTGSGRGSSVWGRWPSRGAAGGGGLGGGGGRGPSEWLVAMDPVRRTDEVLQPEAETAAGIPEGPPARHSVRAARAAAGMGGPTGPSGGSMPYGSIDTRSGSVGASGEGTGTDGAAGDSVGDGDPSDGTAAASMAGPEDSTSDACSSGPLRLLGPAKWRQLMLRQLGALVRPVRQADWEAAEPSERRAMLLRALRV